MVTKYLKFVASRLVGTLVDTLVLWVLSAYVFSSYIGDYIVAPTISFEAAVFVNFIFSYYWIWSNRVPFKSTRAFFTRFFVFNISCILGFAIKMAFLLLFERLFGWGVVLCNFIALLISGIANYALAELVVFKKRQYLLEPVHDWKSLEEENHKNHQF